MDRPAWSGRRSTASSCDREAKEAVRAGRAHAELHDIARWLHRQGAGSWADLARPEGAVHQKPPYTMLELSTWRRAEAGGRQGDGLQWQGEGRLLWLLLRSRARITAHRSPRGEQQQHPTLIIAGLLRPSMCSRAASRHRS